MYHNFHLKEKLKFFMLPWLAIEIFSTGPNNKPVNEQHSGVRILII